VRLNLVDSEETTQEHKIWLTAAIKDLKQFFKDQENIHYIFRLEPVKLQKLDKLFKTTTTGKTTK